MSLSAFLQQYVKPSRWWRRQKTLQITIWPKWLAQFLCTHVKTRDVSWDVEAKIKTVMCLDCYKHLVLSNDCAHGEVRPHAWETVNIGPGRRSAQLRVVSYLCEHCGITLEFKDLPPGVRVTHQNMGGESLWRD